MELTQDFLVLFFHPNCCLTCDIFPPNPPIPITLFALFQSFSKQMFLHCSHTKTKCENALKPPFHSPFGYHIYFNIRHCCSGKVNRCRETHNVQSILTPSFCVRLCVSKIDSKWKLASAVGE